MKEFLKKIKNIFIGGLSTDISFRYLPVMDLLNKEGLSDMRILEVGSGDMGITPFLKKKIVGADIFFSGQENKLMERVKLKDEFLPFADSEFDIVISVDSLEHINPEKRAIHIKEMVRAASEAIILMVPSGEKAYKQDCELDRYFERIYGKRDMFLKEHVVNGLPEEKDVIDFFKKAEVDIGKKLDVSVIGNYTNLKLRMLFMKLKIGRSLIGKVIYYLMLAMIPFRRLTNQGDCYRKLFYIKI